MDRSDITRGPLHKETTWQLLTSSKDSNWTGREKHLVRTLREYVEYYNDSRTNQSLDGNAPTPRAVERVGEIVATPVLCDLHHRYSRAS